MLAPVEALEELEEIVDLGPKEKYLHCQSL